MKVVFKPSFLKELDKLPFEINRAVQEICFTIFPRAKNLSQIHDIDIKPLKGYKHYYRIRIGNYRVGFKHLNGTVMFIIVLHRKDIYRNFP